MGSNSASWRRSRSIQDPHTDSYALPVQNSSFRRNKQSSSGLAANPSTRPGPDGHPARTDFSDAPTVPPGRATTGFQAALHQASWPLHHRPALDALSHRQEADPNGQLSLLPLRSQDQDNIEQHAQSSSAPQPVRHVSDSTEHGPMAAAPQQRNSPSGRYVHPGLRNKAPQQLSAMPAMPDRSARLPMIQQQLPSAPAWTRRNAAMQSRPYQYNSVACVQHAKPTEPAEFAVQLFPDMTSLSLKQQENQSQPTKTFSGHAPPDHHSYTAFHDYIAHVCPEAAVAFGADVWLDTFHSTVGSLFIPVNSETGLSKSIAAKPGLPSVEGIEYTTTELRHSIKPNRLRADTKGVNFYHLGLEAAPGQLDTVLQPWISALHACAAQCGAELAEIEPFERHHITIRCHTKKPVPPQVLQQVAEAVRQNPLRIKVAGIRIQLAASVALERLGADHVMIHKESDRTEVRYPVPLFTSGEAASKMVERQAADQTASGAHAEASGSSVAANLAAAGLVSDSALLSAQIGKMTINST